MSVNVRVWEGGGVFKTHVMAGFVNSAVNLYLPVSMIPGLE